MKIKRQAFDIFQIFIFQAKLQFKNNFKYLRTNFREECFNKVFEKYKTKKNIK